ncbi:cytochrome P450 [Dichomitus squalens]|uniref:Cytochrome P450 n=1 Tax=Dichomitus squalens TaxID=114155 RepID=A0A4Q9MEC8_9APHY|nr:cytochrome P450 [Dichomitus squalens]
MPAIVVFLTGVAVVAIVKIWQTVLPRYRASLRRLPGPPGESFVWGNLMKITAAHGRLHQAWVEEYGPNVKIHGMFTAPHLLTTDLNALHYVLSRPADYCKPGTNRRTVVHSLGKGILAVEGQQHRNQRRVMNPAFWPAQIRDLNGIFLDKAKNLCDYWGGQMSEDGRLCTYIGDGLSKMTLDVIGLAGFNYEFDALQRNGKPNELNLAFKELASSPPQAATMNEWLRRIIPFTNKFYPDERAVKLNKAEAVIKRIGHQLIKEKREQILSESSEKGSQSVEKRDVRGRDLLTLLMKANMATDIPDSQRLTDDEVLAQIPAFLVAGHETTSTAASWTLFALTKQPALQRKLRDELFTMETDAPTMEELNALPYLDQVIHETLRLHAPVIMTTREAQHDDVIPVSQPYTDERGKVQHNIGVAAKNRIFIPILALHTSKQIWGDDALEFKPERWDNPPEAIANMPGIWGHLLTFLAGPHACIGYRFSLVELKALIFTLIRNFEFELGVPVEDVVPVGGLIVQRPGLRGQKVAALPLILRPYKRT